MHQGDADGLARRFYTHTNAPEKRTWIVVHHGSPSGTLVYGDSVSDVSWLLMENLWDTQMILSKASYQDYSTGDVRAFLNGDFYNAIDDQIKLNIKEVTLPFTTASSVLTNLQDKVFILSRAETEFSNTNVLSYFANGGKAKRIAYTEDGIAPPTGQGTLAIQERIRELARMDHIPPPTRILGPISDPVFVFHNQ